jgi:glutathione S-transferase
VRLWQFPFSTNVERVALALAHKGLDAEPVVIDPADRSPVIDLTGQPLVPVLEDDDGTVVADSRRILAHLEERHPHPALYPADPARREEVLAFLDWFDLVWKRPPNLLADALVAGRDLTEPELAAWSAALRGSLDRFENLLQGRDFLLSTTVGVVDFAVYPFLRYGVRLDDADSDPFHHVLVDHLGPELRHPRLREWIARCEALPRSGTLES